MVREDAGGLLALPLMGMVRMLPMYVRLPKPHGRAGPADIAKARPIAEAAKEVSQPDG